MSASKASFPLSAKLISATVVLLAIVVGLSGVLHLRATERIYDTAAARQRARTIDLTRQTGSSTARRMAATMTPRVLGSEWQNLQEEIERVVRDDPDLEEAAIVDLRRGNAIVHSDHAKMSKPYARTLAASDITTQELGDQFVVGAPLASRQYGLWLVYGYTRLNQELKVIDAQRRAGVSAALKETVFSGVGFLVLGILIAIIGGVRLASPIRALGAAARRIASGDLLARTDVKTRDEIGELGTTFNYMADRIEILMQETAQKLQLENELAVARAVTETLVPAEAVYDGSSVSLAGYYQPASECGGDWWNYFELTGGRVVVMVGDVTGHGVPSAMITASAKSCCDTVRGMSGDSLSLLQMMTAMNFAIYQSARRMFVMTMFVAMFDPVRKVVSYANAAHNFPYVVRDDGGTMSCLAARGNRLGDRLDSEYGVREDPIRPGDLFVLYTDGLVECTDRAGTEFGEKRLRRAILDVQSSPVVEIRDQIVSRSSTFFGTEPRKDDITVVAVRVKG